MELVADAFEECFGIALQSSGGQGLEGVTKPLFRILQ
jgi:hypothetical protein